MLCRRLRIPNRARGLIGTLLVLVSCATGCQWAEKWRGEGFAENETDAETWQTEMRAARQADTNYGGVSTKAQQIERNLGVE